ncbi:cyanoexosortase A [Calothrix rhizosoleniae]|uniref:cyanoexosortase A n=1 Tax=Calothrix rhizosoleniae TaxID=888997 RepID=UPI000B4981BB|nr:cyanoexosortase A [Calothrix rhizosoleniae]
MAPAKWFQHKQIWLVGIILSLMVLYLSYYGITQDIQSLVSGFIFTSGTSVLLWKKRRNLTLDSDIFSSIIGTIAIAVFPLSLFLSIYSPTTLPIFFFIAMMGVAMLASGKKGVKQYWQELSLILTLAIPGTNFLIWWLKLIWLSCLVKNAKFWFLCLTLSLTPVYLHKLDVIEIARFVSNNILAIAIVIWLVWQKRNQIQSKPQKYSTLLGVTCIALVCSQIFDHTSMWLQILPALTALGIALITSGFSGLKQYWREFAILLIIGIFGAFKPQIEENFGLASITAQFAHYLVMKWGIPSVRQGTLILFSPETAVEVTQGCAGYRQIFWLLEIALFYVVLFSSRLKQALIVPTVAVFLAFIGNSIRVLFLSILVSAGDKAGYVFWHDGKAGDIFVVIPTLIFGLFCLYLIKYSQSEEIDDYQETKFL